MITPVPLLTSMSDLQDKLDRGEITLDEYRERWLAEMEENERLHPGIHDRLHENLMVKYPGPGIYADGFFASE
jgi:hypothetical protein